MTNKEIERLRIISDRLVNEYIETPVKIVRCSYCSSIQIVNTGTCNICLECGTTGGCS